ncbi:hypothetical protein AB0856_001568 [Xenorhabdus stockiae]
MTSPSGFIPAPPNSSDEAFAIELLGDSMESSSGGVSFYDGMIITFEFKNIGEIGNFVLVRDTERQIGVFRQLILDQESLYLRPLNNNYPLIPFTKYMDIVGVAIHAQYPIPLSYRPKQHINMTTENPATPHPLKRDSSQDIQNRLDKIESMLEQLLKK